MREILFLCVVILKLYSRFSYMFTTCESRDQEKKTLLIEISSGITLLFLYAEVQEEKKEKRHS